MLKYRARSPVRFVSACRVVPPCSCERGHALIELALLMPTMLILVLSGLEAVAALRISELATTLSREIASQSFRQCSTESTGFNSDKFDPEACLEREIMPLFKSRVGRLIPDAEFIVSVYAVRSGTNVLSAASVEYKKDESTFESAYDSARVQTELSGGGGPDTLGSVLKDVETVVIAEVAVPHPAFWRFLPNILGRQSERMYASTVI